MLYRLSYCGFFIGNLQPACSRRRRTCLLVRLDSSFAAIPDPRDYLLTNAMLYRLSYCGRRRRVGRGKWPRAGRSLILVLKANGGLMQGVGGCRRRPRQRICAARKRSREVGLSSVSVWAMPGSSGA